jgi:hypothetical protein
MISHLGVTGTLLFGAGAGAWMWARRLTAFHRQSVLFSVTGLNFRARERVRTYRDYPAKDGAARYDDVWGG